MHAGVKFFVNDIIMQQLGVHILKFTDKCRVFSIID